MDDRSEGRHNRLELRLIISTSLLVFVLGTIAAADLFSEPPQGSERLGHGRFPASEVSLEQSVEGRASKAPRAEAVRLDCITEKMKRTVSSYAKHIRIVGRWCGEGKLKNSEVHNRSNGIVGTTFNLQDNKAFTSDYIDLADGNNQILVKIYSESGESKMAQLVVERQ